LGARSRRTRCSTCSIVCVRTSTGAAVVDPAGFISAGEPTVTAAAARPARPAIVALVATICFLEAIVASLVLAFEDIVGSALKATAMLG
jgi:hypothetical protein